MAGIAAAGSGLGALGCWFEAATPGRIIRVRVGDDGRTLAVRLCPEAMQMSAAELATDIVSVTVLAYMRFQSARNLRAHDEVAAYAGFVARWCGRQRQNQKAGGAGSAAASEAAGVTSSHALASRHDRLAARVVAQVKRILAVLISTRSAPLDIECASVDGDVVLSVDPAGRLVGLWLSSSCTTGYSNVELEALINRTLGSAVKIALGSGSAIPA